jgi:hypothetical protein
MDHAPAVEDEGAGEGADPVAGEVKDGKECEALGKVVPQIATFRRSPQRSSSSAQRQSSAIAPPRSSVRVVTGHRANKS